jgi:Flp pilus assembly protein TadG
MTPGGPIGRRADGRLGRDTAEAGSAVVDFALVGGLLTLLFAAVVQLGIALHVHSMLVSCAAEGARYGARADHEPLDAAGRTRTLIAATLNEHYARDVSVGEEQVAGVRTVVVRVRAPWPVFGLFGVSGVMHATGHAFVEAQ